MLPLSGPLLRRLLRRARRIVVGSPDYIASSPLLAEHRERCTVIPYGIEPESLALTTAERSQVEAERAAAAGPSIVFVGVLRYYKGLRVLLRAMTKVAGRLFIVGRGDDRATLQADALALGLGGRVSFTGELSAAALRVRLHAADVFVLPSLDRSESFGIAQLEAMACGKPVVASDLPTGVRFVTRDGETGLLVPPGHVEALADALNRLVGDPALLARLGRQARARVDAEFTAERMVARMLA